MENKLKILLIRADKIVPKDESKGVKTLLHYSYESDDTNYSKGHILTEQWFDGVGLFDRLKKEDFGKTYDAEIEYEHTPRGLLKIKLVSVKNAIGRNLLV